MTFKLDRIEKIYQFLMAQDEGRGVDRFVGKMRAADQRAVFGEYLGRGTIVIDWLENEIQHIVKVAFGQDFHITATRKIYEEWPE